MFSAQINHVYSGGVDIRHYLFDYSKPGFHPGYFQSSRTGDGKHIQKMKAPKYTRHILSLKQ
jgi:hypothetical protein